MTMNVLDAAALDPNLLAFMTVGVRDKLAAVDLATTSNKTLSGEQTIDGVLTSSSRVLVKNQTSKAANGIYVTAAGAWSRATDADTTGEIYATTVYVKGGATNIGATFWCNLESGETLGTDPHDWILVDDLKALEAKLSDLSDALLIASRSAAKTDTLPLAESAIAEFRRCSQSVSGSGYKGGVICINPSEVVVPSALRVLINPAATLTKYTLEIIRRPLEIGDDSGTAFGNHVSDVTLMAATEFAAADVGSVVSELRFLSFPLDAEVIGPMLPTHIYAFVIRGFNVSDAAVQLQFGLAGATGLVNWERGYHIKTSDGLYQVVVAPGPVDAAFAWRLEKSVSRQIERIDQRGEEGESNSLVVSEGNPISTSNYSIASYKGISVGFNPTKRGIMRGVHVPLLVDDLADVVQLYIWRRPLSVGDGGSSMVMFGSHADDVLIYDREWQLSELGITDENRTDVFFDTTDVVVLVDPDYIYGIHWRAFPNGGVRVGIATAQSQSFANQKPDWARGQQAVGSPFAIFAGSAGNYPGVGYTVEYEAFEEANPVEEKIVSPGDGGFVQHNTVTAPIGPIRFSRASAALSLPRRDVAFAAIVGDAIAQQTMTLTNYSGSLGPNLPGTAAAEKYRYVDITEVLLAADDTPLVEGDDWISDENAGWISRGPGLASNTSAKVTYTGYKQRYDAVSVNRITGQLVVTQGTARIADPENYKPAVPAGHTLIAWAYITKNGVDIIPVHKARGFSLIDKRQTASAIWLENRRKMAPIIAMRNQQLPITVRGYGDSTTDMSNDSWAFFGSFFPTDTMGNASIIPRYSSAASNSLHPSGVYIHAGWNWGIKSALEAHGCVVTYDNKGVGGTTSDNSNAGGVENGLYPARWNPILAAAERHLLVIGFGMNEGGSTATYGNIMQMCAEAKAVGYTVLVVPQYRRNLNRWNYNGYENSKAVWLYTQDAIESAARDSECAYVPMQMMCGPGNEAVLGLSPANCANQNSNNHAGIAEYDFYRKAVVYWSTLSA